MPHAKSLTWLHLSDLHFGHGSEAALRFGQKVVTTAILRDAVRVAAELGPPDVVFVTGDIAFSASADVEYPAAAAWLGKLLGALRIGPERVLTVPGNHDVDRRKALEGPSRLAHRGLRARPNEIDELLEKAGEMEVIWPKLAAYQTFARAYGSAEITPARPFWTKRLASALGTVEVIGLNTALLSFDGSDSRDNLALGLGQLHRALDSHDGEALLFVLQHHPPGWLRDGRQLRAMLKDRAHLLLYGHVHEQHGFVTLPFTSRGNVELVAGAGHQDADETGEHAYAWGRLHRDGLDYFPRTWLARENEFLAQRISPPAEQKGYSPQLGEFVKCPRARLPEALASWLDKSANDAPTAPAGGTTTLPPAFHDAAEASGHVPSRVAADDAPAPEPAPVREREPHPSGGAPDATRSGTEARPPSTWVRDMGWLGRQVGRLWRTLRRHRPLLGALVVVLNLVGALLWGVARLLLPTAIHDCQRITRNDLKSQRWSCELACRGGDDAASCTFLAMFYRDNNDALLERACEGDDMLGCAFLGRMYEEGKGDVVKSSYRAVQLYERACNGNNMLGCALLGTYLKGGPVKDHDRAVELFQRACDGGEAPQSPAVTLVLPDLCSAFGWGLIEGPNLSSDRERGIALLRKGCSQGSTKGCSKLRDLGVPP